MQNMTELFVDSISNNECMPVLWITQDWENKVDPESMLWVASIYQGKACNGQNLPLIDLTFISKLDLTLHLQAS